MGSSFLRLQELRKRNLSRIGPSTASSGNLLSNGDFETPPYDTVAGGWTVSGTGNIAEASDEGTTDGTHAAAFNIGQDSEGTIISQSFATIPGQSYKLEFDTGIYGIPDSTLQLRVEIYR